MACQSLSESKKKILSLYYFHFLFVYYFLCIGLFNVHEIWVALIRCMKFKQFPSPHPSNYTFTVANLGENITVMSKRFCVDSKIFFNISNAIIISDMNVLHFHLAVQRKECGVFLF